MSIEDDIRKNAARTDRLQSQVVDLARDLNALGRRLDKLEIPAIEPVAPATPNRLNTRWRNIETGAIFGPVLQSEAEHHYTTGGQHIDEADIMTGKLVPISPGQADAAELIRLRSENASLHVALFHVENGLNHPDPAIQKLIEAALAAKDESDGK